MEFPQCEGRAVLDRGRRPRDTFNSLPNRRSRKRGRVRPATDDRGSVTRDGNAEALWRSAAEPTSFPPMSDAAVPPGGRPVRASRACAASPRRRRASASARPRPGATSSGRRCRRLRWPEGRRRARWARCRSRTAAPSPATCATPRPRPMACRRCWRSMPGWNSRRPAGRRRAAALGLHHRLPDDRAGAGRDRDRRCWCRRARARHAPPSSSSARGAIS